MGRLWTPRFIIIDGEINAMRKKTQASENQDAQAKKEKKKDEEQETVR